MLPKKTASYVTGLKIADFLCKFADRSYEKSVIYWK